MAGADAAALLAGVQAAIRANDLKTATTKALAALDAGVEHPMLLNLRALKAEEEGRAADALPDLQRAHELAPNDFTVVNALGLCLARLERYAEAAAAFDQAIALEPRFAPAYHNRGWVSETMGDVAGARRGHELALQMNPGFTEATAALAMMEVRAGDFPAARARAERILEKDRNQPTAQVALASAEIADGQFAVAEARMRLLLAGNVRRILPQVLLTARGLWADALDGLDNTRAAFDAYQAEKAEALALHAVRLKDAPGLAAFADWAEPVLQGGAPWARPDGDSPPAPVRGHVFIVGLPGSGVADLAQAFRRGGEALVVPEGYDPLDAVQGDWLDGPDELASLAAAPEAELEATREGYWAAAAARTGVLDGGVLVDASPGNLQRLPLIVRLFPDALVLVARRDPRDVAVELLRRHPFRVNAQAYELLGLQGSARAQARGLALTEAYAEKLPTPLILVRYEDLAEQPEMVAEGLAERAAARVEIAPLAGRELPGQWRRYARELAPVMGELQAWAERLGYDPD